MFAFSTEAKRLYTTVDHQPGDVFLLGPETRGLPEALLAETPAGLLIDRDCACNIFLVN